MIEKLELVGNESVTLIVILAEKQLSCNVRLTAEFVDYELIANWGYSFIIFLFLEVLTRSNLYPPFFIYNDILRLIVDFENLLEKLIILLLEILYLQYTLHILEEFALVYVYRVILLLSGIIFILVILCESTIVFLFLYIICLKIKFEWLIFTDSWLSTGIFELMNIDSLLVVQTLIPKVFTINGW